MGRDGLSSVEFVVDHNLPGTFFLVRRLVLGLDLKQGEIGGSSHGATSLMSNGFSAICTGTILELHLETRFGRAGRCWPKARKGSSSLLAVDGGVGSAEEILSEVREMDLVTLAGGVGS